jgi:hypothetical protein
LQPLNIFLKKTTVGHGDWPRATAGTGGASQNEVTAAAHPVSQAARQVGDVMRATAWRIASRQRTPFLLPHPLSPAPLPVIH